MHHARTIPAAMEDTFRPDETMLKAFLFEYHQPLRHAAKMVGGRSGERLVDTITQGVEQPGNITQRVRSLLVLLRNLLHLELIDDESWSCAEYLALNPEDPAIHEIYQLADSLNNRMQAIGCFEDLKTC
jgi:hypothetical protein